MIVADGATTLSAPPAGSAGRLRAAQQQARRAKALKPKNADAKKGAASGTKPKDALNKSKWDMAWDIARAWLDRFTFAFGITVKGLVVTWAIITSRAIANLGAFKGTIIEEIAYREDVAWLEMLPNFQRMTPGTFNAFWGRNAAVFINLALGAILFLVFIVITFPLYLATHKWEAFQMFGLEFLKALF